MPASSSLNPVPMPEFGAKLPERRLEDEFVQVVQYPELFLSDGNIVLALLPEASPPSSATTAASSVHVFRVHKSVLGQLSDVWKGLFGLAQPVDQAETYGGVECVRLFGDDPGDMREFLQHVYCQKFLPRAHLQAWRTTEQAVAGTLRISTKYAVSSLRDRIIEILEDDWPSSLEAWNANERITRLRMETLDLRDCFPEPASIIRLARDCNVPSLLPAAFYHANELIREDPTRITEDKQQFEMSLLSREDLGALIIGREAMRMFLSKWLMTMPNNYTGENGPRCGSALSRSSPTRDARCCNAIPLWWLREFLEPGFQKLLWPIDHLELFQQELERDNRICVACRAWLVLQFKGCTEHIWHMLPEWFLLKDTVSQNSTS
ncbi:hypothetical protein BKA62DRAFT_655587 [Auriculariales sp. MPI-PUGE-AT-0066]|nr:hypothetical protein BKA62DRAFT_655587 [Auriculariales sp. MPI-PUGE-AT-0066]